MNNAATNTRTQILDAAHQCILESGYANFTTRQVAQRAGVPLSQIHYHFGSKGALLMSLLESLTDRRIDLYIESLTSEDSLSKTWRRLGENFIGDLESGYSRLMQELIAAGYSNDDISKHVSGQIKRWHDLFTEYVTANWEKFAPLGPIEAEDVAALILAAATGVEQFKLIGISQDNVSGVTALARLGTLLEVLEEGRE